MSPIHDQSYRRYQGTRQPVGRGWTVIMWAGVRQMLARRPFLGLMLVAWIPFLVRTVQIYAVTAYPQAGQVLPIDAKMPWNSMNDWNSFGLTGNTALACGSIVTA